MSLFHSSFETNQAVGLTAFLKELDLSLAELDRSDQFGNKLEAVLQCHSFRVPRDLADRCVRGSFSDPILRQFLPDSRELEPVDGFSADPLEELGAEDTAIPFLLQKYTGRALFLTTACCAANCRFCFRRGRSQLGALFSDSTEYPSSRIAQSIRFLKQNKEISEVILSGGDPLVLDTPPLVRFLIELATVSHLKRIRIHTRYPILVPTRIDESFLALFDRSELKRLAFSIVFHINHPAEINDSVRALFRRLHQKGVVLLSQTVLLRDINARTETLCQLFEELGNCGVVPYYLHQLDRVQGAAHFEVPEEVGLKIMDELRVRLSGWLVPKYVREVPGFGSKKELF